MVTLSQRDLRRNIEAASQGTCLIHAVDMYIHLYSERYSAIQVQMASEGNCLVQILFKLNVNDEAMDESYPLYDTCMY